MYVSAAALAFAVAAGGGAIGALMLQGDTGVPAGEDPRPLDEQEKAARPQETVAAVEQEEETVPKPEQEEIAAEQDKTEYAREVSDIQSDIVETFLQSHDKLLRYDALTAADVEELEANATAIGRLTAQVDGLDPPESYRGQYETFRAATNELHEAARLAHSLAADPTAATKSRFDKYDAHVDEAATNLRRSNELLGRDYETLEGVRRISPLP